ncbi:MAG TPA: DedA family protein [Verrucomicrobiae bacterium]|nr:DedA family protein [Verrucomicrobiae bacterium]
MDFLKQVIDMVLHLDKHLDALVGQYGPWIYVLLFLIIFCETGLVVTPILPGDSLLFAVGALAARPDGLNLWIVLSSLIVAAILGDSVNYWIGYFLGEKLQKKYPRLIRPEHVKRTHDFYERYGGKTIIIARFVPIVRTFAPFVAGLGKMTYSRFMMFNVSGALLWILLLVPAGYFFGNLPFVRNNFSTVILAIIILSIVPGVIEFMRERKRLKQGKI